MHSQRLVSRKNNLTQTRKILKCCVKLLQQHNASETASTETIPGSLQQKK
jgi:hypothetical protein